jgi:hypothetical protein
MAVQDFDTIYSLTKKQYINNIAYLLLIDHFLKQK